MSKGHCGWGVVKVFASLSGDCVLSVCFSQWWLCANTYVLISKICAYFQD